MTTKGISMVTNYQHVAVIFLVSFLGRYGIDYLLLTHVAQGIMEGEELTLEVFKALHEPQLQAIGLPDPLVSVLYCKISAEKGSAKTDLTRCFEVCPARDGVLSSTAYTLRCRLPLHPVSDVFVVQHAWDSDGSVNARKQLHNDPQLLARMETLLGIEQLRDGSLERTQEEMVRTLCNQSGKSEKVARKSLIDTNYDLIAALMLADSLSDADCHCEAKEQNERSQPQIGFEEFKQGIVALLDPRNDITDDDLRPLYADYLKEKASGPVEDVSGVVHCGAYSWSDDDSEDGVITVSIPIPVGTHKRDIVSKLRSSHWTFGIRRSKPIIDKEFSSRVIPDECFWTLEGNTVSVTLQKLHVGERWGSLLRGELQLSQKEVERAKTIGEQRLAARVDAVFEKMWFVNQTYQAVTQEGQQKPVWYLMENYGLALTHSDHPNFSCRPFANAVTGKVMSVMWPVEEVLPGDVCTRDFVPPVFFGETLEQRAARRDAILSFASNCAWKKKVHDPPAPAVVLPTDWKKVHDPPAPAVVLPTDWSKRCLSSWERPDTSSPLKVCIRGGNSSKENDSWESVKGYVAATSLEDADIILGYGENVPLSSVTRRQFVARMEGDGCLISNTRLCKLARGQPWFAPTVDVREELAEYLCQEDSAVCRWYVLLPGERGSPILSRVTKNKLEVVRWAEVGPCVASQFSLLVVQHNGSRASLHYQVVVISQPQLCGVFLHHCPRVTVGEQEPAAGFDQWNTAALLTSGGCVVPWTEFLKEFTAKYKTSWSKVEAKINQAIAELFAVALPRLTGHGAVYSVNLLVRYPSLDPLITGVDPLPASSDTRTTAQCLDVLLGRGGVVDDIFTRLLPVLQV